MTGVEECYRGKHVRVFRLDREAVVGRLRTAATHLIAGRDDVLDVWLFGSLARGEAVPGSDADILIVVRDGPDTSRDLAPAFERLGIGCDVFVYGESEVAQLAAEPSLVRTALQEGVRLASRKDRADGPHPTA